MMNQRKAYSLVEVLVVMLFGSTLLATGMGITHRTMTLAQQSRQTSHRQLAIDRMLEKFRVDVRFAKSIESPSGIGVPPVSSAFSSYKASRPGGSPTGGTPIPRLDQTGGTPIPRLNQTGGTPIPRGGSDAGLTIYAANAEVIRYYQKENTLVRETNQPESSIDSVSLDPNQIVRLEWNEARMTALLSIASVDAKHDAPPRLDRHVQAVRSGPGLLKPLSEDIP